MKNIFEYISATLLMVLAVACQKAELDESFAQDSSSSEVEYNKLTFTLDPVSAPKTKVVLGEINDGKQAVKWEIGDGVYIMRKDGDSGSFWANSVSGDGLTAEFYGLTFWSGGKFRAVYPSNAIDQSTTGPHRAYDTFVADLPDTQNYREGSFGRNAGLCMAEWDEDLDEPRTMRNLTGALRLSIKGNFRVGKIVLTDNDENFPLTGCYFADTEVFGKQRAEEKCNILTLDCGTLGVMLNSETPVDFHFALPPGALAEGFKADIYDLNGNIISTLSTSKPNTISASVIKAMPVITANTELYPGNPVLLETVRTPQGIVSEETSQVRAMIGDMLETDYNMNSNREYTYNCIQHIVFETGVNKPSNWLFSQDFCLNSIYGSFDTETGTLYFSTESEGFELPSNAAYMFSGFKYLQDIAGFDKVSSEYTWCLSSLFQHCLSLESIDLSNLETSYADDMSSMFKGCSGLTSIDLSGFVTSGVYDMSSMFEDCRSLTSIDVSSFDTGSLEHCATMFSGCNRVSSLVLGQNFSIPQSCDYSRMLSYAGSMTSDNTLTISCVPAFKAMFDSAEADRLPGRESSLGTRAPKDGEYEFINYEFTLLDAPTTISINSFSDQYINTELKALANNGMAPEDGIDHQVRRIVFIPNSPIDNPKIGTDMVAVWDAETHTLSLHDSFRGWDGSGTNGTFGIYYLEGLFSGFESLEEITGLEFVNLDQSQYCSIARLFMGCRSLVSVDMSGMNAMGVSNVTSLFEDCSALRSVITSKAFSVPEEKCSDMFKNAASGSTISITCTDRVKTSILASGSYSCGFSWNIITPTVTMANGRDFNSSLLAIAGVNSYWGSTYNYSITSIQFLTDQPGVEPGSFDYSWDEGSGELIIKTSADRITVPTDMSYMFSGLNSLASISGLDKFDVSSVSNMNRVFYGTCITDLAGIEGWNTGSVTSMMGMFSCCHVAQLDLSGWDVSNVTSMNYIFDNTWLQSINLSGWDTRNNQDFNGFFNGCTRLKDVILGSNFIMNITYCTYFLENAGNINDTGKLNITCPVDETWELISPTHTGGAELIRVQ